MIQFSNWTIQADGEVLARQFDNLTRTLTVAGDIPTEWEWTMLVQVDDAMDILPLNATENGLSIALTSEQLSISGYYTMQLRGTQGELVKHTNQVSVYIPATLSGDKQWPKLPSEFSAMEHRVSDATQRAEKAAGEARGYTSHPPEIGDNGNWWMWDGESYVDTGKPSGGGDASYYPDLSTALTDINGGTADNALAGAADAKVKVFTAENGRLTVSLLGNVDESVAMTVSKDIDLVLAGHTLNLATVAARLTFAEGTSCTINGEVSGSSIVKDITGTKIAGDDDFVKEIRFIDAKGENLTFRGGMYRIAVNCLRVVGISGIRSAANTAKRLDLLDCTVQAYNEAVPDVAWDGDAYAPNIYGVLHLYGHLNAKNVICNCVATATAACGIRLNIGATADIERCTIRAESCSANMNVTAQGIILSDAVAKVKRSLVYANSNGGKASETHSYGITNTGNRGNKIGSLYVEDTDVYATHSAIHSSASLFVRGGTLSAYTHGGFYLTHGNPIPAYFKDVTFLRKSPPGNTYPENDAPGANGYIGKAYYEDGEVGNASGFPGGDVYMDGCTFGESAEDDDPVFALRSSDTKVPNRLFISNSKFANPIKKCRVMGGYQDDKAQDTPGELYIGAGCNFTKAANVSDEKITDNDDREVVWSSPDYAEETNALYRMHYPGEVLTGEDFAVLMSGASSPLPDGDEVSY